MKKHLMIRDPNICVKKCFAYFPITVCGENMLPKKTFWLKEYFCVKRVSFITGEVEFLGNFEKEADVLFLNPTLSNKKDFYNEECFWILSAGTYSCPIPTSV